MIVDFGVTVSSVDIAAIDVGKTSKGYQQLKMVTQGFTNVTLQAQAEVNIKQMREDQGYVLLKEQVV